jgi:hypothetical protein
LYNFSDESFLKYQEVKFKKIIDIMAFLDIKEKRDRIDKISEQVNKEKSWKAGFGQKSPTKII